MFFLKNKKIILECYTHRPDVYEYFPIQRASKAIPEWWKKLSSNLYLTPDKFVELPTMKSCAGFISYYNSSISIPMWSDCKIKTDLKEDSINWLFSDSKTNAVSHHFGQMGEYFNSSNSRYAHMKINSPWRFKCKEEINFLYSGNTWSLDNPETIIIPPGVINYKYQFSTSVNMFVKMGNDITVLNAGSSLVHLFPLTEREVEIKIYLIKEEEFHRMNDMGTFNFFTKSYYKHKNIMREKEKQSKCPISGFLKR